MERERRIKKDLVLFLYLTGGTGIVVVLLGFCGGLHLLLTDVVMPKMGGRELAARVREIHPETRVLYRSGHEEGTIAHHGMPEEGFDLISKPFTEASLAKDMRKVLDR